jgi:hypothetical protein
MMPFDAQNAANWNRPRIYGDFNNADKQGRIRLNTHGSKADLERLGIELVDGLEILLDDHDDVTAEAIVRLCPNEGWVAEVDWDAIMRR